MKTKTARRFLDRNKWKIGKREGNSSFYRRVNQCKVALGADPLKLSKDSSSGPLGLMSRMLGL